MARTLQIDIKETADELQELMKKQKDSKARERIQALYLLKSGQITTLKALSQVLARDTSTLYRWFSKYKQEGITGLINIYKPPGKVLKIPKEIIDKLIEKLKDTEGFNSYDEIREWLKNEFDLEVNYWVVYRTVRRVLKAKLKVPRPSSTDADEVEQNQFKRNLSNLINLGKTLWSWSSGVFNPPKAVRFWCQDEARMGMKTVTGRKITLKGVKPIGKVQWPREAFYTYGVFEPVTGESFYYEFSHVNSECFQIFLNEFSNAYPDSLNIIQLDQASFHIAHKLEIPKNVIFLFQPAHSPNLNPAERVWEEIRKQLRWFNPKTLDELREKIDEIYKNLSKDVIASLTGWSYILEAANLACS